MAIEASHGSTGEIRSTRFEATTRMMTPTMTGPSTVWQIVTNIDQNGTSMYEPASHRVSSGVSIGASRVDRVVTDTDSAVSPGAQPTRMTPTAISAGSP